MQDIVAGNGIGMLAPEQELLTEEILPYIPEERIDDVVYFDPSNTAAPIPLNPLHLDEDADIDLCVDDNLTIFQRLMGESQARMDEILRQSFYALLERPGSTLLDVERLLSRSDDTLRNEIIQNSRDEQTRYFFEKSYPAFARDAHLPITTRINRLVRPRVVRNLLCQPGKSFNFREAMDAGKILLFSLPGPPGANDRFFTVRKNSGRISSCLPYRTAFKNKRIRETSPERVGIRWDISSPLCPSPPSFFLALTC